jgi:hypothetical protein
MSGIEALASSDDRVSQSHLVKKALDRTLLCIAAAGSNFPIAMGVCFLVAQDNPADRPPPCLRCTAPVADEAGNEHHLSMRCAQATAVQGMSSPTAFAG